MDPTIYLRHSFYESQGITSDFKSESDVPTLVDRRRVDVIHRLGRQRFQATQENNKPPGEEPLHIYSSKRPRSLSDSTSNQYHDSVVRKIKDSRKDRIIRRNKGTEVNQLEKALQVLEIHKERPHELESIGNQMQDHKHQFHKRVSQSLIQVRKKFVSPSPDPLSYEPSHECVLSRESMLEIQSSGIVLENSETILHFITQRREPVWSGCIYASEEFVKTEELFQLIFKCCSSLKDVLDRDVVEALDPDRACAVRSSKALLDFCLEWIAFNKGTQELARAIPILEDLVKVMFDVRHLPTIRLIRAIGIILREEIKPKNSLHAYQAFLLKESKRREILPLMEDIHRFVEHSMSSGEKGAIIKRVAEDFFKYQISLLKQIFPAELLSKKWNEKYPNNHLKEIILAFNKTSFFVVTTILSSTDAKIRAHYIEFFLHVASMSLKMGNFSTVSAILAGLENVSISRLKKTWDHVEEIRGLHNLHKKLLSLFKYEMNYSLLRNKIDAYLSKDKQVIPCFNLLQKDILFILEGNPSQLENGHYNIEKLQLIHNFFCYFTRFKKTSKIFRTSLETNLLELLVDYTDTDEERLYQKSLVLEISPRKKLQ